MKEFISTPTWNFGLTSWDSVWASLRVCSIAAKFCIFILLIWFDISWDWPFKKYSTKKEIGETQRFSEPEKLRCCQIKRESNTDEWYHKKSCNRFRLLNNYAMGTSKSKPILNQKYKSSIFCYTNCKLVKHESGLDIQIKYIRQLKEKVPARTRWPTHSHHAVAQKSWPMRQDPHDSSHADAGQIQSPNYPQDVNQAS